MSESTQLTVIERAALALGADEGEKQLIALAQKYTDITDIKNPAGRTQCHAAAMELSSARINVDKTGKAAREDANAFQKAVIAEVARRVAIIKPEEDRLLSIRDTWDEAAAAEKAAIAAAAKARIDYIRKRIGEIQAVPSESVGRSAANLAATIELTEALEITLEFYGEFSGEAELAKIAAVAKLGEMLSAQMAHEAEAKRLQQEREQLARERIEAEERERVAAAARAKQEAADRAERERVAEEQRVIQVRAATLLREQQEAHEARMRAERLEFEKQQAEMAEKQRELREATEKLAREQQEREEAVAAAAKLESDHAEALEESAAIDALRKLAAEARQQEEQRQAAEAERLRRERVQFVLNGPGDMEIALTLAAHYQVAVGDAMQWLKKFDYDRADEQFAALNATGNLPHLDQAA